MKIDVNKFYLLILFFFRIVVVSAEGPPPPSPFGKRKSPPPPPGLPIDENILILIIFGVLFGFYVIYNFKQKKKTLNLN